MNRSDWIEWKGGEQPVADETEVEVRWTDLTTDRAHAGSLCWLHAPEYLGPRDFDIIAYRIVEDSQ